MDGIAIGIVKENWNEDYPGKLRVEYVLGEDGTSETKWIPVMTPYAGVGYGSYALPENGAEVVLGFVHGSRHYPMVLGCLWDKVNTLPAQTAAEKNNIKHFSTKAGWRLILDEEAKTLALSDPEDKNKLNLAVEDGCLSLDVETKLIVKIGGKDFITLEEGKVTIAGDVAVESDGDMSVKGKNIVLEPQSDLSVKGTNMQVQSSGTIAIKGSKVEMKPSSQIELSSLAVKVEGTTLELAAKASGKFQSDGMLELKGSMMKLN